MCDANFCRCCHRLLLVGAEVMIFDFFAFMTVLLRCAHLYKVRVALVSSVGLFVMMKMSSTYMYSLSEFWF